MDDSIVTILALAYTAWAIYSGYKFLSGRSEWLDQKAPLNMIVKIALSIVIGYVIGAFYLFFKIINLVSKL